jgi:hypothetical protein
MFDKTKPLSSKEELYTFQFISLLYSLHATCMQQLGKVVNPLTNKIERSLEQAKATIDMVEMLREKTKGNLTSEEEKTLGRLLSEMQMNYADEVFKEKKAGDEKGKEEKRENTP